MFKMFDFSVETRVARLLTRPAGRVRKFAGNGGSGRVQFGQKLKFNFEVSWYLCFILHFSFSISRVVFSVGYKAT